MFFFSSRRRHTRSLRDWSSDVCSSDLSNIDAKLISQGITAGNPVNSRWDLSGELGGRIVPNKLGFYYSTRRREEQTGVLGAFKEDGSQATGDQFQYFHSAKLSYQVTQANKLLCVV